MSRLTDPLLGRQLGSYLIQDLLGEGGMARVYLGRHHHSGDYAAVKVFEADRFSDAADAERFRREGRSIFRLRHPNIVKFLEFGVVEDLYFLVVEFVDGADLGWVLGQYRLRKSLVPYHDVIAISKQIGEALDYVHGEGIVHRDVKPTNVLLTRKGRALLTDFGLALSSSESTEGTVFGSALYVSPEQAVNSGNAVPQSDIYSFGAVLYEMLTGSPPFGGETPISIVLKHINETPASPSQLNPSLAPGLESVLLRALSKEPHERYSTAASLVDSLTESIQEPSASEEKDPAAEGEGRQPHSESAAGIVQGRTLDAPSVRDVVESRPMHVTGGVGISSLAGSRQARPMASWSWGLILAAVIMGALTAAVAVAGGQGNAISQLLRDSEPSVQSSSSEDPSEPGGPAAEGGGASESDESVRDRVVRGVKTAGSIAGLEPVSCSGNPVVTRLRPDMYAYAIRSTPLYDTPRTEHNLAIGQFVKVLDQLEAGERMLVLDHESYPNCYQEAYFLKVRTDDGTTGWVHEWRWHYYIEP